MWPCCPSEQREAFRSIHCSGDGRHAESCCLASRASRQCRRCASCISQRQATEWVCIVDAPKDVPTPTRDHRCREDLGDPAQSEIGRGTVSRLGRCNWLQRRPSCRSSGWSPEKERTFLSIASERDSLSARTMRGSLTCMSAGRHVSWTCLPVWVRQIESKRLPLTVAYR